MKCFFGAVSEASFWMFFSDLGCPKSFTLEALGGTFSHPLFEVFSETLFGKAPPPEASDSGKVGRFSLEPAQMGILHEEGLEMSSLRFTS